MKALMKALLLAAILVLPGCAILPDEADLLSTLPSDESFQYGILIEKFPEWTHPLQ